MVDSAQQEIQPEGRVDNISSITYHHRHRRVPDVDHPDRIKQKLLEAHHSIAWL
jgi:hypothetical protein